MKIKSSITIKRPNGETEIVDTSVKFGWISEELFAAIKKATAAAGKGEVLSYTSVTTFSPDELAEMETWKAADKLERRIRNS